MSQQVDTGIELIPFRCFPLILVSEYSVHFGLNKLDVALKLSYKGSLITKIYKEVSLIKTSPRVSIFYHCKHSSYFFSIYP